MVGVELKGRLGNQFFHYAFARYVIHKRGDNDDLVIGDFFLRKQSSADGWMNSLGDFNIYPYTEEHRLLALMKGTFLAKFFYFCYLLDCKIVTRKKENAQKRWRSILNRYGVIVNTVNNLKESIQIPSNRNIIIDGNFENPAIFHDIKPLLQKEFVPVHKPLESNRQLLEIIERNNSVCVTIRRGDFLSPQFKDQFYICTPEYFKKAIDTISIYIDNPIFIFFSDDIDWVKENIKVSFPCYYESGCDPVWEKIRLMYSCKHFIISNSTFSWIAQYLCQNQNKIVISPSRWHNYMDSALLDDSFVKIEV